MTRGFRLAALERLRTVELQDAGQALARANDALSAALARRAELTRALRQAAAPSVATPAVVVQSAHHRERLRAERAQAAAAVDELTARLALARQGWLDARTALRAVETLHERHRAAVRAEQARLDQRAIDEVAGIQAARRGAGTRSAPGGAA